MWARDAELLGKIVAACITGALCAKRGERGILRQA